MQIDRSTGGASWRLDGVWAKLEPRNEPMRWHPLVDHCHDVAACVACLLEVPLVASRLARLDGRTALPRPWLERLIVLAFLHDFGKANHAFQDRRGGHIAEAAPLLDDADLAETSGLTAIEPWFADELSAVEALAAVLTHHGAPPPSPRSGEAGAYVRTWQPNALRDPLGTVRSLVEEARQRWPLAFAEEVEALPRTPAFWHGFLGLLQLADWLGSDSTPDAFPFTEPSDLPRHLRAREVARRLARDLGLNASALRSAMPPATFEAVSGGQFPARPIQAATAAAEGPVVVLESETGSGKTEAALHYFARLFEAGRVDGLYFALPTRLAATQMVARVQAAVERLFPEANTCPVVVRAIPGDAGADGQSLRRLPDFVVQWDDDPDAPARRRRWAAEGPKRFLAATIAVGTIDQALLGAVRVKHAQMRSFFLSRSLLVVDEVHASDRFMATILGNLLDQHLRAGGEALLLSATLGAEARTRLLLGHLLGARQLAAEQPRFEAAEAVPYPAISTVSNGHIATVGYPTSAPVKRVEVRANEAIADPDAVAAQGLAAARAGARVLVIRNTVRDAVATRQALDRLAPDDAVQFRLEGIATLHHSRFAREDRRRLDAEVERQFGKTASRERGLVLVGTQTLEISLDIDADLLITDLCPARVAPPPARRSTHASIFDGSWDDGSSARAEIDPSSGGSSSSARRLLRPRGDRPDSDNSKFRTSRAPPPARRSTFVQTVDSGTSRGSSARAEIDPGTTATGPAPARLLRPRGDRPNPEQDLEGEGVAPPPARRSTQIATGPTLADAGSSARAEIDPGSTQSARSIPRLLRPRGDRPKARLAESRNAGRDIGAAIAVTIHANSTG